MQNICTINILCAVEKETILKNSDIELNTQYYSLKGTNMETNYLKIGGSRKLKFPAPI